MIFTDTHTHLHFKNFAEDLESILERSCEAGVKQFMVVGTNLECSQQAIQFAESRDPFFASVGCHPHDAKDFQESELETYRELMRHDKVRAIGEIGLDFFRNISSPEVQENVFRKFLGLHRETKLPLILHIRDAHDRVFEILEEELTSPIRGLMHCFSGDETICERAVAMGFWISFACNITYKKNEGLRKALPHVPQDRILLETDCPFLPPEGKRGKRNEPAYLVEGAQCIAEILGLSVEDLAKITTANANELFSLPAWEGAAS